MSVSSGNQQALVPVQVHALREQLWESGFRPVPIVNHDAPGLSPGKRPLGQDWTGHARLDPPFCVTAPPVAHALNTGILCDGLRAIDIDIDDPSRAHQVKSLALDMFGEAPMRYRANSPRVLLLYRAAVATPEKRSIVSRAVQDDGKKEKVEVLGRGQQFVAFGIHDSGAVLHWLPEAPGVATLDSLTAVTEAEITEFLTRAAGVIDAPAPGAERTAPAATSGRGLGGDPLQVIAALCAIPNDGGADWEAWNRVGMATWAATGGSEAGRAAFHAWSQPNASYDTAATDERWFHYRTSPPTQIGAGTLFYMARGTQREEPPPASEDDYGGAPDIEPDIGPDTRRENVREPDARAFKLLFFRDIRPVLDTRDFVQGTLMEQGAGVVYGESNAGKTFWATDAALHVAAGLEWNGLRVEQGGVVYCVLEGGIGFHNRVAAWKEERGLSDYDLPFAAIPSSMNLLDPNADTGRLISSIQEAAEAIGMGVKLVVIDTLSRALAGGNENAPDDMGALVKNMDRIRSETGACVLFVHHSGKDAAKGARGHSLLRAAVDTEIEVVAEDGSDAKAATVVKQREMKKGQVFAFKLKTVILGKNRHGEEVTTCVVEVAEDNGAVRAPALRLKGHAKRALDVLQGLIISSGRTGDPGVPSGCASIPEKWWRDRFYESAMPGSEQDAKQKAFRRTADQMVETHIVGMAQGRVWIVQKRENVPGHFSENENVRDVRAGE